MFCSFNGRLKKVTVAFNALHLKKHIMLLQLNGKICNIIYIEQKQDYCFKTVNANLCTLL